MLNVRKQYRKREDVMPSVWLKNMSSHFIDRNMMCYSIYYPYFYLIKQQGCAINTCYISNKLFKCCYSHMQILNQTEVYRITQFKQIGCIERGEWDENGQVNLLVENLNKLFAKWLKQRLKLCAFYTNSNAICVNYCVRDIFFVLFRVCVSLSVFFSAHFSHNAFNYDDAREWEIIKIPLFNLFRINLEYDVQFLRLYTFWGSLD